MRYDRRARSHTEAKTELGLVVHGDGDTTAVIRNALARAGFARLVECRGADTIAAIERVAGIDLVVIDGDTDGVQALDLIAYLRHRLPQAPILFVAPAGAALVAEAARMRGATRCLTKPVQPPAVTTAVQAVLDPARHDAPDTGDEPPLVQAGRPRAERAGGHLWGVVLAGGEGRRLRPLVRHIHGEARPKQYATLVGTRTLLGRTLDRAALLVPAERRVLVTVRRHRRFLGDALAGRAATVLAQPSDRGTAAGIALPVQWILQRDPEATVVILPSDHFVAEERRFMAHVADAAAFVDAHPERLVLVGVEATEAETEYGWIEPGEPLARIGPTSLCSVARFVEKPSPPVARACLEAGALWNTFVVIGRAATLADATRQLLPGVHGKLQAVAPLLGTAWGVAALRQAYADLPTASFSSAVLERCGPLLAVSRLTGATWCDWGSPRRVVRSLQQIGWRPAWLQTFTASRLA
jgi:mannose-1-phosphate guanylyltransferase/ActR/RegA family two-component response regulator